MERNYWILCADKEKWHPQMGNDFDSWEKWNKDIGYESPSFLLSTLPIR